MTTSKELVEKALRREEVDRVPFCAPFQGYWALGLENVTVMDSIKNPKVAAEAQYRAVEECHIDGVEVMWDWLLPAEALGCKVKIPEHGTIPTVSHIINGPEDLDKLELPDVDGFYRFKAAKETARHMSERLGKDHFLMASILSPFTLAGEVRGVDNLMVDSFMDEDFVQALIGKCLEITKAFTEEIASWDIDAVIICDPTASGDLISAADYVRFSKGPMSDLGAVIRKCGKMHINHICGDTSDRLDIVADTGCVAFSVDKQVDVGDAVSSMKGRMAIIGNVDPAGTLFSGTPDDVRRETRIRLEKGGKKGYLLGSGCDIPVGAKYDNVLAMSDVFLNF
ncbi:MAG: uroporphyrinogen decarboxylase family protein [Candidatus Methanoplasma sp.]|jgi:MtaA/CmuA family methyltransferase|nr:uroporphyrinogen decarboxylase family protein [Candidatus Methanoplasma sp.]